MSTRSANKNEAMAAEGAASRHTTFRFTLLPTSTQAESLRRHVGAARFAYNQSLRLVKSALEANQPVPWSGFDLINAFNAWKVSPAAGIDDTGEGGLPWRATVCQQVFEESAVDLGRGLASFSAWRKGERRGKAPSFPRFKKKATARASFRLRNRKNDIRVGTGTERTVRLPVVGQLRVRECTRNLRRMLKNGRAKILFATVAFGSDGRWQVTLNVEAKALHPARQHARDIEHAPVGIDRGLTTFAVVADREGRDVERVVSPRPFRRMEPILRAKNKDLSRKEDGSRNRHYARAKLARAHARMANVRRDFVHKLSTRLAKNHGHLVIEDLCTSGLMKTRLARSIADSAWALFGTMLKYKSSWLGGTVTVAARNYPSTRRCSACGVVGPKLGLSERRFHCSGCGHEADRDTNAAANLAGYLRVASPPAPHVVAKHAKTKNACREGSAGPASFTAPCETLLDEAGTASAGRPRRTVLAYKKTVNTL